jgi:hypothetical protein
MIEILIQQLEMPTVEFISMLGGMFISLFIGSLLFFGVTSIFAIGEGCFIAIAGCYNAFVVINRASASLQQETLYVVPFLIGLLAFTRLTRYRWAARYPVAILSGVGAGIVFAQMVKSMIINNVISSVEGVLTGSPDPLGAWLIFIPQVITPIAFTYSIRYSGWLQRGIPRHLFTLGRTFFLIFVGGRMGELAGGTISSYLPNWAQGYMVRPLQALSDYLNGNLILT